MKTVFAYKLSLATHPENQLVYFVAEGKTEGEMRNSINSFIHENEKTFKTWGARIGSDKPVRLEENELMVGGIKKFNVK